MSKLKVPSQVSPGVHASVLESLRASLEALKTSGPRREEVLQIRVRDWRLTTDEGRPCLQIDLDKGYPQAPPLPPFSIDTFPKPILPETRMSLDTCMEIHHWLLESKALDNFDDELCVQVGSPGPEPTLRECPDFCASVGLMVRVETQIPVSDRSKFTAKLTAVLGTEKSLILVLSEGSIDVEIPVLQIKSAHALPFHVGAKNKKSRKKG